MDHTARGTEAWDGPVAAACAAVAARLAGMPDAAGLREASLRDAWNRALAEAAGGVDVRGDGPVALDALPGVTGAHDAAVGDGDAFAAVAELKVWRDAGKRGEGLWDAAVIAASVAEHRAAAGYMVVAARTGLLDDGHPLAALVVGGVMDMAAAFTDPALGDAAAWFMAPGVAGAGRVPERLVCVPAAREAAGEGWAVAASRIVPSGDWVPVPDAPEPLSSSPPTPRFLRDRQKALVERFLEEVLNAHDLDALDRFVAPGFTSGLAGGEEGDADALRDWLADQFTAFPDMRWRSNLMLYEEQTVVVRLTGEGTHLGTFHGVAPTGRRVRAEAVHIIGLRDGRMASHYRVGDEAGIVEQLTA
ncbi:MAG: ester cyclase [Thermoleophilia bacterium]|nr:ester cyclase [Thermoleophilia bacterium]